MAHWLDKLPPNLFRLGINLWGPFIGASIKVKAISHDFKKVTVCLKQHWYNSNYVGTHFGGSMFSMTDPFFMLILIKNLGKEFIVWDKAASIEFIKPGRGLLQAQFEFSEEELAHIREETRRERKYVFDKAVDIVNNENDVVARVVKTLYVSLKKDKSS